MTVETVRALVLQAPGERLCDAGLAFACGTSLSDMQVATEALLKSDPVQRGSSCAAPCRRSSIIL
jgi:hypothetical protein